MTALSNMLTFRYHGITLPCDGFASRQEGHIISRIPLAVFEDGVIVDIALEVVLVEPYLYRSITGSDEYDVTVEVSKPSTEVVAAHGALPVWGVIFLFQPVQHVDVVLILVAVLGGRHLDVVNVFLLVVLDFYGDIRAAEFSAQLMDLPVAVLSLVVYAMTDHGIYHLLWGYGQRYSQQSYVLLLL